MKFSLVAHNLGIVFLATVLLAVGSIGIALPAEEKPSWQNEWARTVEAAKKEGRVWLIAIFTQYSALVTQY